MDGEEAGGIRLGLVRQCHVTCLLSFVMYINEPSARSLVFSLFSLSLYLTLYLSHSLSLSLSHSLSISLTLYLSLSLSHSLSIYLSLSISLTLYLSIFLSLSPCFLPPHFTPSSFFLLLSLS